MSELTKQEAADLVYEFVGKIKKGTPKFTADSGAIDGDHSNRGNKLKLGAEFVHRDRIDGYNNDIEKAEPVDYNRSTRTVFKRRRLDTYIYEDPDYEASGSEDDPYFDIDLEEILRPIGHPSELSRRESVSRTYTSNVLKYYAQQSIEMIEKEQNTVNQISQLLDLFLGEDSSLLLEDGLAIPQYDHQLKQMAEENEKDAEKIKDKRITRKAVIDEADTFFALPKMKVDPNQGLTAEEAKDARELSQLAVQRMEEFISQLTNVRNGLSRAQYVKEKLYAWGREMNGDPDESDIYVAEREAIAKAAQAEREAKASESNGGSTSPSNGTTTPIPTGRRGRRRAN